MMRSCRLCSWPCNGTTICADLALVVAHEFQAGGRASFGRYPSASTVDRSWRARTEACESHQQEQGASAFAYISRRDIVNVCVRRFVSLDQAICAFEEVNSCSLNEVKAYRKGL